MAWLHGFNPGVPEHPVVSFNFAFLLLSLGAATIVALWHRMAKLSVLFSLLSFVGIEVLLYFLLRSIV